MPEFWQLVKTAGQVFALFLLSLARAQEEENAVGHGLPLSQGLQRFFYAGIESPELEKKAQGKFFYETGSALPGTMGMRWVRFPLKELLAGQTRNLRQSMKISQDEMAELLRVSSRAYGDLERGKYCFSTTTLMFFLLLMKESELEQLLKIFKERACA